jgi:hypothetical protein
MAKKYSSLKSRENTFLSEKHKAAYELCFILHDIMLQLLASGEKASVFNITIPLKDDADRIALNETSDIFDWLEKTSRHDDKALLLVTTVLPAVLSDMLHCIYEALESSRKGKLAITFMLLRKPLQESLFLMETIIVDRVEFVEKLSNNPQQLYSQKAGGLNIHTKRIQRVIDVVDNLCQFNSEYVSQLRYDKNSEDSFDGICNKAMHLFTDSKAIRTEPLNINFIFSDDESKETQWSYLYSRLPYLLLYTHRVVEYIFSTIITTDPDYLKDMERRISAHILLWWSFVEPDYADENLWRCVYETQKWLDKHCQEAGYPSPSQNDLVIMADTGAYPMEPKHKVRQRYSNFNNAAKECIKKKKTNI